MSTEGVGGRYVREKEDGPARPAREDELAAHGDVLGKAEKNDRSDDKAGKTGKGGGK